MPLTRGAAGANDDLIARIEDTAWLQNIPKQHDLHQFNRPTQLLGGGGPTPPGPVGYAHTIVNDLQNSKYADKLPDAVAEADLIYHDLRFGARVGISPSPARDNGQELTLATNGNSNGRSVRIREHHNNDHPNYIDEYWRKGNQWYFSLNASGRPAVQDVKITLEVDSSRAGTNLFFRKPNSSEILGPFLTGTEIIIPAGDLASGSRFSFGVGIYTKDGVIADAIEYASDEQSVRNVGHFTVRASANEVINN